MRPVSLNLTPLAADMPDSDDALVAVATSASVARARPLVGVVRNPRSHRNRTADAPSADDPRVLAIAPLTRDELAESLAGFAKQDVGLIVIDGGDGTIRDVLSRGAAVFGERWPVLAVLPKGKTNALACDLGMPQHWSIGEAVDVWGQARIEVRHPLVIECIDDGSIKAMGFILGAGVFNNAIDAGQVAHRYGAFQGLAVGLTTGWSIVQALFGFGDSPWRRPAPIRLYAGADRTALPHSSHGAEGERFGVGLTTLYRFPFGLRPFRNVGDGIHCLAIDAPLRRAVALIPAVLMGAAYSFLPRIGIHRAVAEEYTMELGEGFILDGEVFPGGHYRVRKGPALRFLVP